MIKVGNAKYHEPSRKLESVERTDPRVQVGLNMHMDWQKMPATQLLA